MYSFYMYIIYYELALNVHFWIAKYPSFSFIQIQK